MPFISRLFIRSGLLYFVLAMVTGILLEFEPFALPPLMPLFWHMLMLGWITQIIMGVSLWMFPGRTREEGFIKQKWSWLTFLFLDIGLALRIIAEPMLSYSNSNFWRVLIVASAGLQVLAAVCYFIEIWPRVLTKKQQRKRRKKKRGK